MSNSTIEPLLIVTPEQLKQGWMEWRQGVSITKEFVRREFIVLRRRDDGNYVVRNPKLQILEEEEK